MAGDGDVAAFPNDARNESAKSDIGKVGGEEVDERRVAVSDPAECALLLFAGARAVGHCALAHESRVGGLEPSNPLGGEGTFAGETMSAGAVGEKGAEGAVGISFGIEQAKDTVQSIPIVVELDETTAIGLKPFTGDIVQGQPAFAGEAPGDWRATVHEFGAKLDGCRRGGLSYGMDASTNAIARFDHDAPEVARGQLAGRRQASGTGTNDDDVSRCRHG